MSDHPGSQARGTAKHIADDLRRIAEHQQAAVDLSDRLRESRHWWQLGRRIRDHRQVAAFKARTPRVDPNDVHRLARQRAGVSAEDRVTRDLVAGLPEEGILFRGYRNRRGEVDHLVVGPFGVWAVEVKGRGVVVNVDGDRWTFEKYDRYGNRVEQGQLVDRGGRSWGRQVGDIAGDLEKFLRSRGARVTVRTAVVVMHGRARLGRCFGLGVTSLSVGTAGLIQRMRLGSDRPPPDLQQRVGDLVRRDHAFHARKRRK